MELILFLSYPDRLWDCGALRLGIEGLEHGTGHSLSSRKVKSACGDLSSSHLVTCYLD